MLKVEDEAEFDFIRSKLGFEVENNGYWIGLKDTGVESMFVWADGSKLEYGSDRGIKPWMDRNEPNQKVNK